MYAVLAIAAFALIGWALFVWEVKRKAVYMTANRDLLGANGALAATLKKEREIHRDQIAFIRKVKGVDAGDLNDALKRLRGEG